MQIKTPYNSTYQKGGVSCSKGNLVVNQALVLLIEFCGKNPDLRVAPKRYGLVYKNFRIKNKFTLNKTTSLKYDSL